jgi:hypothetical protein
MAKNLRIESSTDSKAERDVAALQPYTTVSVTIATARPSVQREDGGTEAAEPDVQTSSQVVPSRELRENAMEYYRRVREFTKQNPDFPALVDQSTEIPLSARDQVLRMPNGPDIALFLSFAPEVCSHLCKMDAATACGIDRGHESGPRLGESSNQSDQLFGVESHAQS